MMSPLIQALMQALRCLPGVGPKSAQRMTLHLLERNRSGAMTLAGAIREAVEKVGHCRDCRTLCEEEICAICRHSAREQHRLCVVESPVDIIAIEQTNHYRGRYFVLHGRLSPITGLGPEEIGAFEFRQRLAVLGTELDEVILATNPTVEGETTAYYLAELIKEYQIEQERQGQCVQLKVTRLAHGIPLGGELEYLDGGTVAKALLARTSIWAEEGT